MTPLYHFLHFQLLTRKEEHISTRPMYDDVNECFWQIPQLALLLPDLYHDPADAAEAGSAAAAIGHSAAASLTAYEHLCASLQPATASVRAAGESLDYLFTKTYLEKTYDRPS